jgi:hypothetical protein
VKRWQLWIGTLALAAPHAWLYDTTGDRSGSVFAYLLSVFITGWSVGWGVLYMKLKWERFRDGEPGSTWP